MVSESDVYVVVPAYNEAGMIGRVVADLRSTFEHVVVVDDGSNDDTGEVARESGALVVRHSINRGQGAALQTGITFALRLGASVLVTFDADGQHRVEDVRRMIDMIREGSCDVCLGSRFLDRASIAEIPPARRLLLRGAIWFTRIMSGLPVTDAHNGLRALTRSAAERIEIRLDRMAHASEIVDCIRRGGLRVKECPVTVHYSSYSRQKGQSGLGAIRIAIEYVMSRWFY